jgi:hypothetical protein
MKKLTQTMTILLAVFLLVSLTVAAVSAAPTSGEPIGVGGSGENGHPGSYVPTHYDNGIGNNYNDNGNGDINNQGNQYGTSGNGEHQGDVDLTRDDDSGTPGNP